MARPPLKIVVKNPNFITGIGAIGLAVLMFSASFDIKEFVVTRAGASFMPRVTAGLFAILGSILVFESFRYAKSAPANEKNEENVFGGWPAVILSAILMCAYVGLLNTLGFIVSSVVYIFLQMLVLAKGAKCHYLLFSLISILVPIIVYFLFVHMFKVMIPSGILG